jgi:cystathionine beta-lyase
MTLFSSGMAAVSAVLFSFLRAGDHLVLSASAYGPTLSMARDMIEPLGVEVSLVDPSELVALEDHLRENTRLVYLESPASLTFELTDLGAVAKVARAHSIPTVVDNSWATPIYQKPARFGIDLSLHSGTKYLSGHSDLLLGMVAGSGELIERVRKTAVLLGGCVSPDDAFLAVRGLRTLSLRMQRHQDNGLFLSHKLMDHPRVLEVLHPANPFFPGHGIYRSHFSG